MSVLHRQGQEKAVKKGKQTERLSNTEVAKSVLQQKIYGRLEVLAPGNLGHNKGIAVSKNFFSTEVRKIKGEACRNNLGG